MRKVAYQQCFSSKLVFIDCCYKLPGRGGFFSLTYNDKRNSKWSLSNPFSRQMATLQNLLPLVLLTSAANLKKLHQHRPQTAFLISSIFEASNHVPCRNFSREKKEKPPNYGGFRSCAGELQGGQREPKKNKPRNHDGTGSSRRETKGNSLEIMMELDPVEGVQTGRSLKIMMGLDPVGGRQGKTIKSKRNWIQPRNHDGTGSSRRVSNLEIMTKQKPVEL